MPGRSAQREATAARPSRPASRDRQRAPSKPPFAGASREASVVQGNSTRPVSRRLPSRRGRQRPSTNADRAGHRQLDRIDRHTRGLAQASNHAVSQPFQPRNRVSRALLVVLDDTALRPESAALTRLCEDRKLLAYSQKRLESLLFRAPLPDYRGSLRSTDFSFAEALVDGPEAGIDTSAVPDTKARLARTNATTC